MHFGFAGRGVSFEGPPPCSGRLFVFKGNQKRNSTKCLFLGVTKKETPIFDNQTIIQLYWILPGAALFVQLFFTLAWLPQRERCVCVACHVIIQQMNTTATQVEAQGSAAGANPFGPRSLVGAIGGAVSVLFGPRDLGVLFRQAGDLNTGPDFLVWSSHKSWEGF